MDTSRIRSPKKARALIDSAAVEIAVSMDEWPSIVNTVRALLGQSQLPAEVTTPQKSNFVIVERSGASSAAYPIFRLKSVDGGGMNAVHRSHELFTGREIAVRKHLPTESAEQEAWRSRRERLVIERLANLPRHPTIPRFWTTGVVEGERCEVFDFAPGVNLNDYAAKNGLRYGEFLDIGIQAARALLYLHRNGLIHGDVKPQNFCVSERTLQNGEKSLRLSLIDFDTVATPEEQLRQYALGSSLDGTLPFMPPENFCQMLPEDPDDARRMVFSKDVFALGLSLARVAMGKFPESYYTDLSSLLEKKTSAVETVLDLPDTIPPLLAELLRTMTRSNWQERPDLAAFLRTFLALKEWTTPEERAEIVAKPSDEAEPKKRPAAPALGEHVGPYRVLNRSFAPRPPGDGQELPLAALEDKFGRRLIGVPFVFTSMRDEAEFYDERRALLADLNEVRAHHPELFPGSFRDLVREESGATRVVWIIRPLLEGALDLKQFLQKERPHAPPRERLAILRRAAEALAVLEKAGYTLPRLTSDRIFFVPQPRELAALSATQLALTRPIQRLFDIKAAATSLRFRQELMGTAFACRTVPGKPSRTVSDLLDIARDIGLYSDLGAEDLGLLQQITTVPTWKDRVGLLTMVEMQSR